MEALKDYNKFQRSKISDDEYETLMQHADKTMKKEIKETRRHVNKGSELTNLAKRNIAGVPPKLHYKPVSGIMSDERVPGMKKSHTRSLTMKINNNTSGHLIEDSRADESADLTGDISVMAKANPFNLPSNIQSVQHLEPTLNTPLQNVSPLVPPSTMFGGNRLINNDFFQKLQMQNDMIKEFNRLISDRLRERADISQRIDFLSANDETKRKLRKQLAKSGYVKH